MVFGVFGLLRQVWACVGREKRTTGSLRCVRIEMGSHLVAFRLALTKSAYIRPFREVVQLLSRMGAYILDCFSVLRLGLIKEHMRKHSLIVHGYY